MTIKGIGGAPRLFDSVEEFIKKADEYFSKCFDKEDNEKLTWTGLCLAVGANSRQTLEAYKKGERGKEYVDPIKKALLIVENHYERTLKGAPQIFVLKNFNWRDNLEITGNKEQPLEHNLNVKEQVQEALEEFDEKY